MKRLPLFTLSLLLFILSVVPAAAQKTNDLQAQRARILADRKVADVIFSEERSTPSLIYFAPSANGYSQGEAPQLLRNYLPARAGYDDFLATKQTQYNQYEVPEYQQFFKGIKVEYSRFKALSKSNHLLLLAGSFYNIPEGLSVRPAITRNEALMIAKNHIGASRYVYEDLAAAIDKETNPVIKARLQAELKTVLPKGEIVIVKDFTKKQIDMRLAYKFDLYATEPLSRGYIYVDAQTGKILLYNAIIKHASVPTTVTTRYAGNRSINVKQVSGNDPNSGLPLVSSHPTSEVLLPGGSAYVLIDDTRGNGIETYDLNAIGGLPISVPGIYGLGKSFTDVDNNWTLAEHKRGPGEEGANELENDDIAWDAHWGASVVYDYWKQKHGRLSYDNNNAAIKSYIHYGPAYDNAFWNGTAMTYGDGSGEAAGGFKPLTSLDVCGHEIGHGVCSFTSDLVYESESGAMNEALSDIWAACIEKYAMQVIDKSLASVYKPFFIGEQISSSPLRRMDDPKLASNPDTYGGQYWANPDCTPTLVNDQCGVHNNSGVLNKWFYLLTVGSGNGSGPDAGFAIPGVDDGMKDNGTILNSIPYEVTGVGFDVAERITYLTEMLLSSTATYAEFRDVAIGVAKAYSGDPCGLLVQSVTNAMFAVGVGAAFTSPCTTTFGFVLQPGVTVNENNGTEGCDAEYLVNIPVLLPANSSGTFSFTGSATINYDYVASTNVLNNSTSTNKIDTLHIFIKNDAVIEGSENIVITVAVTNLGGSAVNTAYTVTITDDDVAPVIGNDAITLLSEDFDNYPDGFEQPSTWTEVLEIPEVSGVDPTANGKNQWGVFSGRLSIAPKTGLPVPVVGGTYLPTSVSQTRIHGPKIDSRGLTNVQVKFDYTVQGEVDPNGVDPEQFGKFDYMALTYSYDGINFSEFGRKYYFASAAPVSGTFSDTLPAFLNNQQFYLGFRWVNDANAGGPVSVSVDNLVVKADPRKIESDLNNMSTEVTGPNQQVYFYSRQDGQILAKVENTGSLDYGCVTASVQRAGNATFNLFSDADGVHKVGNKVVRITPSANNTNGAYQVSLYLRESEIAAIENATGKSRNSFFIYKTTAATVDDASSANTEKSTASYTNLPGVGGIFTASFSTGFSSFAVGAVVPAPLPVTCIDLKGIRAANAVVLNWKVANEVNNKEFEVERSLDGINFTQVSRIRANSLNNGAYTFSDNIRGLGNVYYRLKQVDADGNSRYVCTTLYMKMTGKLLVIGSIYPNPGKGNAFLSVSAGERTRMNVEILNALGQLIERYPHVVAEGNTTIHLKLPAVGTGNYYVRFKDQDGKVLSTQLFVVE